MSKTKGILYHIGGRLRKDKGWSEKESDNPPDKFWEGEIENNLPNGFGTYTHRNGSNYVGYYKDGLREGEGTWTLYDKINFVGIWKEGKRWNGTSYDEEGNEVGQYVNGELENHDNLLWWKKWWTTNFK